MVTSDACGARDRPALDLLPSDRIVELLLDAEARVVPALRCAVPRIAAAAELVAARLAAGGRLALAGAGTSGRLAVVEAAELPGTFGLPDGLVVARVAGGGPDGLAGTDWDEDDIEAALRDLDELALCSADVLIAVAASGRTPYTLALAGAAAERGVALIAVVNQPGSPLASCARVPVEVPVGPEVLRGSTRLSAGTAQKVALNAITTVAMVRLGRVHGDLMVDVVAANAKLRERVAGIVAEITGASAERAYAVLDACEWNARAAVVHLVTGLAASEAAARAAAHPTLRAALSGVVSG